MSVEVIVVGGGFTGVIAAAALSKAGAKVKVFEAAVKTDPRFRGELQTFDALTPHVREIRDSR